MLLLFRRVAAQCLHGLANRPPQRHVALRLMLLQFMDAQLDLAQGTVSETVEHPLRRSQDMRFDLCHGREAPGGFDWLILPRFSARMLDKGQENMPATMLRARMHANASSGQPT